LLVAVAFRCRWFVVHWQRSRAAAGAAQHSHGTTHSHIGEPTGDCPVDQKSASRACHARAAPALHSPHHVGRGRRPPPSQLPTHTVARPDPPLVPSQAERSQAVALPHSLPPSVAKPPGTHAPAAAWRVRAQAAPSRRLGSGRAWRKQGAKTRQEERREVLGRRKGLHVCTSPGRDTGDMGRARGHPHRTLQPSMTVLESRCLVMCWCGCWCVCWCVCEGGQIARVCMDVCVCIDRWVQRPACNDDSGGGGGEQQTCGARVAIDAKQTWRRQGRHGMSGPRDQPEAASWRT
jgi:hypothetical protein